MITRSARGAISIDGGPTIATVSEKTRSFTISGREYEVRTLPGAARSYELWRDETKCAALASQWPRDRYALTAGDMSLILQRRGLFGARCYAILEGKEKVGEVKTTQWNKPDLTMETSAPLPVEVQLFLIWLARTEFTTVDT